MKNFLQTDICGRTRKQLPTKPGSSLCWSWNILL